MDHLQYFIRQARGAMQTGGDMPAFAGARYQKGHGLGSIFAKMRAALPWFFKAVGKQALKTGVNVAQDVIAGKKLRDAIRPRLFEGVKSAIQDIGPSVLEGIKTSVKEFTPQSGSGRRRVIKRHRDIFE
jgi:hypothetical protein